jgi:hypothetical protein
MPHPKPFYNIYRPLVAHRKDQAYLLDDEYAPSAQSGVHAYSLLEDDLVRIFRFVEPSNSNLGVYSHELYQLLLRVCTEFESHAKTILARNGYAKTNYCIKDYHLLEQACRLSEYEVRLPTWSGAGMPTFAPFSEWSASCSLTWYQDYNTVKHNRVAEFRCANLKNVLTAMSGVFAILFAQLHYTAFGKYRPATSYQTDGTWYSEQDRLLEIRVPTSWSPGEHYDFDWTALRLDPDKLQRFQFVAPAKK